MQSDSWARKSKIQGDFRFDVVNMIVLGLITLLFFYPMYPVSYTHLTLPTSDLV